MNNSILYVVFLVSLGINAIQFILWLMKLLEEKQDKNDNLQLRLWGLEANNESLNRRVNFLREELNSLSKFVHAKDQD